MTMSSRARRFPPRPQRLPGAQGSCARLPGRSDGAGSEAIMSGLGALGEVPAAAGGARALIRPAFEHHASVEVR